MSNTFRAIAGALLALAFAATAASAAQRVDFTNVAFVKVSGPTSIPVGAADFCKRHRADCAPTPVAEVAVLTPAAWDLLVGVNDYVNTSIVADTDQNLYGVTEYWTYPENGAGDCEDFALEKRRLLIASGWDASTLLMTVVRQRNGEGHAVLTVRTDRGDLVLDNQDNRVLVWNETPYEFIKRQSQSNLAKWVGLEDTRIILASK